MSTVEESTIIPDLIIFLSDSHIQWLTYNHGVAGYSRTGKWDTEAVQQEAGFYCANTDSVSGLASQAWALRTKGPYLIYPYMVACNSIGYFTAQCYVTFFTFRFFNFYLPAMPSPPHCRLACFFSGPLPAAMSNRQMWQDEQESAKTKGNRSRSTRMWGVRYWNHLAQNTKQPCNYIRKLKKQNKTSLKGWGTWLKW
jgi:hypothetical protein